MSTGIAEGSYGHGDGNGNNPYIIRVKIPTHIKYSMIMDEKDY